MAQSVSNDALWEKLSEVDKKLEKLSEMQKSSNLSNEQLVIKPDFQKEKDEIITEIKQQSGLLGKHGDINFAAVNQNSKVLDENIRKVLSIAARIRKQQREAAESQKTADSHFNFRFFKLRKSSFVIVLLGLLVFILTIFCMKQQSDYALLLNEYYRQSIVIIEIQAKVDSLKNSTKPDVGAKKKSR